MVDSVLEVQNIKTTGISPQKDIVTTSGTGDVTVNGNIVVPDSGTIGSASATNAVTIDSSGNTTATLSSSSNIKAPLNASGSAPVYACRAWVNFNGGVSMTVGSSYGPDAPPADYSTPNPIRASGNVSSITDKGAGYYQVNFTTAMQDVNYAVVGMSQYSNNTGQVILEGPSNAYTSSFQVYSKSNSNVPVDAELVSVAVFR